MSEKRTKTVLKEKFISIYETFFKVNQQVTAQYLFIYEFNNDFL